MKKFLCLLLIMAQLLSLAACKTEEKPVEEEKQSQAEENNPSAEAFPEEELRWVTNGNLVEFVPDWSVEGSSESYLNELCSPEFQGRAGGSEGNRAATDWIEEQFKAIGLQAHPGFEGWRQTFDTDVFAVLPGEASIINADGSRTPLELGVDWVFRASPEAIDITGPLSIDEDLVKEGKAFWDASAEAKNSTKKVNVICGDVSKGAVYNNPSKVPSRITVSEEVYDKLHEEGVQLHVKLPDAITEGEVDNVIAYLPGKDSTKAVLIAANFDGAGQCGPVLMPSAYNNASGVAAMIQTAKWLAKADELPCDVVFAAVNSEDNSKNGGYTLAYNIEKMYEQIRMISLKCLGWKGEAINIYADSSESALRNSLASGLGVQYKARGLGGYEKHFSSENMTWSIIIQDACIYADAPSDVVNKATDTVDNLDPEMLDKLAKDLCGWVIERGDEPLASFLVYW